MIVAMRLGGSKHWWAYLALRSNEALSAQLRAGEGRAVLFDDAAYLLAGDCAPGAVRQFFFVLWDGYLPAGALEAVRARIGAETALELLTVGDPARVRGAGLHAQSLYPDGSLQFGAVLPRFDAATRRELWSSRLKTLAMPVKNLLQRGAKVGEELDLLLGRRRLVFCGSAGLNLAVVAQLCERHGVDSARLSGLLYPGEGKPFAVYTEAHAENGRVLAQLFQRAAVDEVFFLSALHLLGREFFVERIRTAGLPLFSNGYASGRNINVYTTPWYRQHVFLDFGSVVGDGNYPRQADLRYFGKRVVNVRLDSEAARLARVAGEGRLPEHFEAQWASYAEAITGSLRSTRPTA